MKPACFLNDGDSMGVITKVNYPKLAEIYAKKGKDASIAYLKSIGVKAPYRAIKRMKENYMYDEELNKYIVPEDAKPSGTKRGRKKTVNKSDSEEAFMSMEELCNTSTIHEMDGEYILPFPRKSRDAFEAEMFLDKLTEYAAFFKIDKSNHICHINKTELLRQGYDVAMY